MNDENKVERFDKMIRIVHKNRTYFFLYNMGEDRIRQVIKVMHGT